jgi:hexosaminidase
MGHLIRRAWACLLFLGSGVFAADDLKLIPWPQSVKRLEGAFTIKSPARISVLSDAAEDRFAAGLLVEELKKIHNLAATASGATPLGSIVIGRVGHRQIDAEIARRKLDVSALDRPEGYVLGVDSSGVVVAAKTAEGVFYGVQTLRQAIAPGARVPHVTVADWPALRYRALSIDINRGPLLTEEQMKAAIESAAEFKLNMVWLYLEHVFQYSHTPVATPPGGEVTPEMMRRVSAHARKFHIELIPHQQMFGHVHNLLKFEAYAGMGEIPHGSVLSPADPRSYEFVRKMGEELTQAFPGEFLKIGTDETWELGKGRAREQAERTGVASVYAGYVQRVVEMFRPFGRKLMVPGDIALKHPEMIPSLPKDLIWVTWAYSTIDDFTKYIEPFRAAGLQYMVCTSVHGWNRLFPAFGDTRINANNFARDGKRLGAIGLVATHWADDGEALFNTTWYGTVFSAAAAWQAGMVNVDDFDGSFDWAFYRNQDRTFTKANRNLEEAHRLLTSAGLREADNGLFWVDPFSRRGSDLMRKAYPVASKMRLLAEDALADLATSASKARRHEHTLQFLRLAAKRIDYLGMKIQFSNEIGEMFRAIKANPADTALAQNNFRRIRGMDGLLPSLRDYTTEVKAEYRAAWLAENRPYYLDNILLSYDREALYWLGRMHYFGEVARSYWSSRQLTNLETDGVFLP